MAFGAGGPRMIPMHSAELSILLHRALQARVEALMEHLAVADWPSSPEPLHQVRVASRRTRAVLELVDPELYPAYHRQTRRLRKLTRALGGPRELDVHLALLQELGRRPLPASARPALEHALEALLEQRRRAAKATGKALAVLPLKRLPQLLEVPNLPNPFEGGGLAEGIRACLEPRLEQAFRPLAGLLDQEDIPALHALRIRLKRLRYALEVLGGGFQTAPEGAIRRLKALQTALGDHHDRATLEDFLRGLLEGLEGRGRLTLATGTGQLLTALGEERLCAFEQFRALALGADQAAFSADLARDLGDAPKGDSSL